MVQVPLFIPVNQENSQSQECNSSNWVMKLGRWMRFWQLWSISFWDRGTNNIWIPHPQPFLAISNPPHSETLMWLGYDIVVPVSHQMSSTVGIRLSVCCLSKYHRHIHMNTHTHTHTQTNTHIHTYGHPFSADASNAYSLHIWKEGCPASLDSILTATAPDHYFILFYSD